MVRIHLEYMNNQHRWQHYQTKHNERDAYGTAKQRSKATGKRFRLVDDDGRIIDLIGA